MPKKVGNPNLEIGNDVQVVSSMFDDFMTIDS